MLIEKPTGEIRTAYDRDNEPYLFEATGKEAKHFCDILRAEDDGRLVILPCKVGDTCYITQRYSKRIIVARVSKITSYTHGNGGKEHELLIHFASQDRGNGCVAGSDFGKTAFPTREEAEAALKGGQEDASNT